MPMDTRILESNPPATEEQIGRLEQDLNVKLPADYRLFLLKYNGGRPEPCVFEAVRNGKPSPEMVDWFLALYDGEYDNLRVYLASSRGRVPEDLMPIAHDPGGNLICMAIRGKAAGTVYFWDHEEESDDGGKPDFRNVFFVAPSFERFLSSLREF